jgi:hypothetical protein
VADYASLGEGKLNLEVLGNHWIHLQSVDVHIFAGIRVLLSVQLVDLSCDLHPLVFLDPSSANAVLSCLGERIDLVVGLGGLLTAFHS